MSNYTPGKSQNLSFTSENFIPLRGRITVVGDAALANIKTTFEFPEIKSYVATTGQPTVTEDATANFPALVSNAAPSTIGILALVGDAERLIDVYSPNATWSSPVANADFHWKANAGAASTPGVTANFNLAFTMECANVNFNVAGTHSFDVVIWYKKAIGR